MDAHVGEVGAQRILRIGVNGGQGGNVQDAEEVYDEIIEMMYKHVQ